MRNLLGLGAMSLGLNVAAMEPVDWKPSNMGLPKATYPYMKGVRRPNMNKYSRPHQGKNVRYVSTDHGITRIKL